MKHNTDYVIEIRKGYTYEKSKKILEYTIVHGSRFITNSMREK